MSEVYVAYVRKSQEDEGRQVQSIENQLEEAERLGKREGIEIVEEIEEARSAKEPGNRPKFDSLMKRIERGEVTGLVAWHPDRLSRNETDAATVTRLLRHGKLKDLRFVSYQFINSPEGIMMLQLALSQSQYQNSKLAIDVRRGLEHKRKQGWLPNRAPEGYLNDLRDNTIYPDPERFDLVRRGWDLILSGQFTCSRAITEMNRLGYRTLKRKKVGGGPLSRSSGYRIFTNPFYAGRFRAKGMELPGAHKPMVTEMEFQRAQQLLAERRHPHQIKHPTPFAKLITCKRCGWRATHEYHQKASGARYAYLHCSNRNCNQGSCRVEVLDAKLFDLVNSVHVDADWFEVAKRTLNEWQHVIEEGESQVTESIASSINEQEARGRRLLDLLVGGVIDEAEFRAGKADVARRLRELRTTLAERESLVTKPCTSVLNALDFASVAVHAFESGNWQVKREMLENLGIACWIDAGQISIEIHPIFQHIISFNQSRIEPGETGSRKRKKAPDKEPFLVGAPATLVSELLEIAAASPAIQPLRCHLCALGQYAEL